MIHAKVFDMFKFIFPALANDDLVYYPSGKNKIRIKGVDSVRFIRQDVVFTYNSKNDWRLESVDSFINNTMMKGEN